MGIPKMARRIFAVVLIAVWGVYAVLNLISRFPNLQRGYEDGWNVSSRIDGMFDAANGGVLFQSAFQNINAYGEEVLDKRTSNNFLLVRGDNGQYMYSTFYTYERYAYEREALSLREVQRALEGQGASFLYVNCIDLYIDGADSYGSFPVSDLNPRSDAFLYYLRGYGVDYLDARAVLDESPLFPSEYRYNTEPHWTIEGAFEVYLGIVEELRGQGIAIDPDNIYTDRESFKKTVYSEYVGELGKRIGLPRAEPESFTLIVPSFETNFTLDYPRDNAYAPRQGDFSSVLLDMRWLESEDPYERNFYNVYLTAEDDYRVIKNNSNADAPKILIIGDSYMLPVASFLATAASEVHLTWPYGLPDDVNLPEFLAENEFDSVIVGMNPNALSGSGFNYLNGVEVPDADLP